MILYKYQAINKDNWNKDASLSENFASCYTINNLFERKVSFSGRKTFNDLFDSKIILIKPTKEQCKSFLNSIDKMQRDFYKIAINHDFNGLFDRLLQEIENKFDEYRFYCISSDCVSNLMWSHYSNSHNGFCIGWKDEFLPPQPASINYEDNVASFELLDALKATVGIIGPELGEMLWNSLRTKLSYWKYESEYRIKLPDHAEQTYSIEKEKNYTLVTLPPEAMDCIIFGYRFPQEQRQYIMEHNPNKNVIYKEIKLLDSYLEAVAI